MSFDFQIGHNCPHLSIEEEVLLGDDRMSLKTLQPVATRQMRITVNDTYTVPQEGLNQSAQLIGRLSGPFRVPPTENTVTISNRSQVLANLAISSGPRVPTTKVVSQINTAMRREGVDILAVNRRGYLELQDFLDPGVRSQVRVSGPGREFLGFHLGHRARGKQIYPPWDFEEQDSPLITPGGDSVRTVATRYPKFTKPIRNNPIFKVTYTTYRQYCRRCLGLGVENDYRIASNGSPITIANEDLLNQDVLKILSTIKGSNPFNPAYGTLLLTRIGSKASGAGVGSINEDVTSALTIFQRLQQNAGQYQEITPRQTLAWVSSIDVFPSQIDPSIFEVKIIASNSSNTPIVVSTVYAAPGSAALAGSNGLSLGLGALGLPENTQNLPF